MDVSLGESFALLRRFIFLKEECNMRYLTAIVWFFSLCSVVLGQNNSQVLFQPEEVVEDINYLVKSLSSIHPTFSQYLSDDSFRAKIDSIKTSIHRPMTKHEFFKIIQPFIAVDTHTSLRFDGKIYPEIEAPGANRASISGSCSILSARVRIALAPQDLTS